MSDHLRAEDVRLAIDRATEATESRRFKRTCISSSLGAASPQLVKAWSSSDLHFQGSVSEEHFVFQLPFSGPQVSCLSGFPASGSRVISEGEVALKDTTNAVFPCSDFRYEISSQSEIMTLHRAQEDLSMMTPVSAHIPMLQSMNYEAEQHLQPEYISSARPSYRPPSLVTATNLGKRKFGELSNPMIATASGGEEAGAASVALGVSGGDEAGGAEGAEGSGVGGEDNLGSGDGGTPDDEGSPIKESGKVPTSGEIMLMVFTFAPSVNQAHFGLNKYNGFVLHGGWATDYNEAKDEVKIVLVNGEIRNAMRESQKDIEFKLNLDKKMEVQMNTYWPALNECYKTNFWKTKYKRHGQYSRWDCQTYFEEVLAKGREMIPKLNSVVRRYEGKTITVETIRDAFAKELGKTIEDASGISRLDEVRFVFDDTLTTMENYPKADQIVGDVVIPTSS